MSPTIKQKKAFDRIIENHGNISRAMIEVGYDETTAKNPKNLTNSNGWKELMATHLSDEKLAKVHEEGLEAGSKIIIDGKDTGLLVPDYSVRHKYLDTAYKLKGSYAPEKSVNIDVSVDTEGIEELKELAKTLNASIKQSYGDKPEDPKETS